MQLNLKLLLFRSTKDFFVKPLLIASRNMLETIGFFLKHKTRPKTLLSRFQ